MKDAKREKLERAGWKVGDASDLLELREDEEMIIEMRVALAAKVRELRQRRKLTQVQLARLVGSSQSRIAKLETADKSVSMELLVRSLASLGASRKEIGSVIGAKIDAP
ncbi:hypothetical protein DSM3645_16855 [Blastopirellula marina DSM 3645]|uniref:HTH cro/C1-type domain-containing protein n=2 Tax=Blastopirellula marina TaxID=124 RepID=A3ZNE6_9BACT|nr:hypothetical protein DSM3645_16855 [Blastopirellula marina DSM 3645]